MSDPHDELCPPTPTEGEDEELKLPRASINKIIKVQKIDFYTFSLPLYFFSVSSFGSKPDSNLFQNSKNKPSLIASFILFLF